MQQLPPDVIAALAALGSDMTPELVEGSEAALLPYLEKVGYSAPSIHRDQVRRT